MQKHERIFLTNPVFFHSKAMDTRLSQLILSLSITDIKLERM